MLGEADPDAIIADRLSGDSPFMATDKMDLNEGVVFDDPVEIPAPAPARSAKAAAPAAEVDLTDALASDDAARGAARRGKGAKGAGRGEADAETARAQDEQLAAEQLRLALTYRDMGMIDDAIASLERAARSSRQRFEAAALLGRIHMDRGERPRALEWFEQAAEAPAPTADAGRALLYDLADALETIGEAGRALAVFAELEADVRGYRDVTARIERLSRVQARG
jgi:pilus assembly protein FimV